MNNYVRISLVLVALLMTGCTAVAPGASPTPTPTPPSTSPSPSPTPTPPPAAGLDGRQFLSVDVTRDGQAFALVDGTRIRLTFDGGQLGAQAGCNTMSGTFHLDGDSLVVGSMATTEMGCNPGLHAQDEWLAALLGSGPTVALTGNDLLLSGADATISLLDREVAEPDQELVGPTWTLTSIVAGDAVASVPDGVSASLRFLPDGTVEVQPGCNMGSGTYAVDGDRIAFADIALTMMACGGAAGQVEGDVLAVLGAGVLDFSIDAGNLTLQAGNGGLIFSAAP